MHASHMLLPSWIGCCHWHFWRRKQHTFLLGTQQFCPKNLPMPNRNTHLNRHMQRTGQVGPFFALNKFSAELATIFRTSIGSPFDFQWELLEFEAPFVSPLSPLLSPFSRVSPFFPLTFLPFFPVFARLFSPFLSPFSTFRSPFLPFFPVFTIFFPVLPFVSTFSVFLPLFLAQFFRHCTQWTSRNGRNFWRKWGWEG